MATLASITSPSLLRLPTPTSKPRLTRTPPRPIGLRIVSRKKDIHPEFYPDAKVYCNGELVMTTGGTVKELNVDVWSGNHPFFQGTKNTLLVDAGQLEKFRKRFGELKHLMEIPTLKGELIVPPPRTSKKKKKK
ncbi:hypothetical protein Droror1_Dr00007525 [Drosera rotundifolia]